MGREAGGHGAPHSESRGATRAWTRTCALAIRLCRRQTVFAHSITVTDALAVSPGSGEGDPAAGPAVARQGCGRRSPWVDAGHASVCQWHGCGCAKAGNISCDRPAGALGCGHLKLCSETAHARSWRHTCQSLAFLSSRRFRSSRSMCKLYDAVLAQSEQGWTSSRCVPHGAFSGFIDRQRPDPAWILIYIRVISVGYRRNE